MNPFKDVLDELTRFRTRDTCCAGVHVATVVRFAGSCARSGSATIEVDDPTIAAWIYADLHFLSGRPPLFRRAEAHAGRGAVRYHADLSPPGSVVPGTDPVVLARARRPRDWVQDRTCCARAFWRAALILRGRRRRAGHQGDLEVSCPDHDAAEALHAAATGMKVATTRRVERGRPVVIVRSAAKAARLLDELGAPDSAGRWRAIVPRTVRPSTTSIARYNVERARSASRELCARLREALDVLGRDAPEELRLAAERRLAHPDLSMGRLAAECDPPRSRNTFTRQLRRLLELADRQRFQ
ncbi:DNA-binding protein WhiA [Saccharothrix sp. NPDC042600]|uniref:DNA-binding protein WhiA n=1 Tax=Saccharothrix TaxID=2071 RepID=UPI0033D42C8C|nr:DNA-binding protein WhiA [Saccharothrix mutabilis subsp. capreolus]